MLVANRRKLIAIYEIGALVIPGLEQLLGFLLRAKRFCGYRHTRKIVAGLHLRNHDGSKQKPAHKVDKSWVHSIHGSIASSGVGLDCSGITRVPRQPAI